ncbi:MAG: DUF4097 domain-containing protein [Oscillospiraceae bacterium]|jgi:DUF4097 and DUF4098 domain-containing protein YvlB|nr:DUF4097 domain-containing protein [Oscillospiraceae bacterium]
MKTRAIVKIVLCCLVALLLCAMLSGGISMITYYNDTGSLLYEKADYPHYPERVLYDVNRTLTSGNDVMRNLGQWTLGDYSDYEVGNVEFSHSDLRGIQTIDIEWDAGTVTVKSYDGYTLQVLEAGSKDEDDALRYKLEDGVLRIRSRRQWQFFSFGSSAKALTVLVPSNMELANLELSTASAKTEVNAMQVGKLEISTASGDIRLLSSRADSLTVDTASGSVNASDCKIDFADIDSASGDFIAENSRVSELHFSSASGKVSLSGRTNVVDFDSASGDMILHLANCPSKIEVETVSGDCKISIPSDSGFRAELDSVSGDLSVRGFPWTDGGGNFVICGDGIAEYDFESVSGDVEIQSGTP